MKNELTINTKVYYAGDQANEPTFGVITNVWEDCFGSHIDISFDDGRKTRVSPSHFSEKYSGNCSTSFVTAEAYREWRNQEMVKLAKFLGK